MPPGMATLLMDMPNLSSYSLVKRVWKATMSVLLETFTR
jgi:hypothetical protein